jgi:hypothetical protein
MKISRSVEKLRPQELGRLLLAVATVIDSPATGTTRFSSN